MERLGTGSESRSNGPLLEVKITCDNRHYHRLFRVKIQRSFHNIPRLAFAESSTLQNNAMLYRNNRAGTYIDLRTFEAAEVDIAKAFELEQDAPWLEKSPQTLQETRASGGDRCIDVVRYLLLRSGFLENSHNFSLMDEPGRVQ